MKVKEIPEYHADKERIDARVYKKWYPFPCAKGAVYRSDQKAHDGDSDTQEWYPMYTLETYESRQEQRKHQVEVFLNGQ